MLGGCGLSRLAFSASMASARPKCQSLAIEELPLIVEAVCDRCVYIITDSIVLS
jgi:hypothetical protein